MTLIVNVDEVWLWRSGRWGTGCRVLCSDRGFLPVSETLYGFPIGPTMVSERRPLRPREFLLERLTGPSMG